MDLRPDQLMRIQDIINETTQSVDVSDLHQSAYYLYAVDTFNSCGVIEISLRMGATFLPPDHLT